MQKSFWGKKWLLSDKKPKDDLTAFCDDELIAKLLVNRDVNSISQAQYYVGSNKPSYSAPSEIPQLDKAIQRINKAIEAEEKIIVYGDYDVDGTTSTALLVDCLRELNANVDFFIPNRFTDGYGLNTKAVISIKSKHKAKLLITCDCGITNFEEVKLAQSLGLDVIVTDHHSLPDELPPAVAVLNPKLLPAEHPLHWLPGVGVAYKLAEELCNLKGLPGKVPTFLDFVALGLIADLAPLRSENRLLVKDGLEVLKKTPRPGLQALLKQSGYRSDEEGVGFAIAPRINAAGRLQDANDAVRLFLAKEQSEADMLAKQLSARNEERQMLCDTIYLQALRKVEEEVDLKTAPVIMLSDPSWHHGVVGIVASRLLEKYHLPVFIAVEEEGSIKGSARGINSINLFDEMTKFDALFSKYGGHKAAAGFSMKADNWYEFKAGLTSELKKQLSEDDLEAKLNIDSEFDLNNLTFEETDKIFGLAPYGFGFTKPVFKTKEKCLIKDLKSIGQDKSHSKLVLEHEGRFFDALFWRAEASKLQSAFDAGAAEFAFTPSKNVFRGKSSLQLGIKDILIPDKTIRVSNSKKLIQTKLNTQQQKPFYNHKSTEAPSPNNVSFSSGSKFEVKNTKLVDIRGQNFKSIKDMPPEALSRNVAFYALGDDMAKLKEKHPKAQIFNDTSALDTSVNHLFLWTMPLQDKVLQDLLNVCEWQKIYVLGENLQTFHTTKTFLG
ncbi:MAG TPA: single-stranded-DNA-specific exonuclease RecJ, partial [Vampirovibrionales bacterium]